jgi:hypothetical protein
MDTDRVHLRPVVSRLPGAETPGRPDHDHNHRLTEPGVAVIRLLTRPWRLYKWLRYRKKMTRFRAQLMERQAK